MINFQCYKKLVSIWSVKMESKRPDGKGIIPGMCGRLYKGLAVKKWTYLSRAEIIQFVKKAEDRWVYLRAGECFSLSWFSFSSPILMVCPVLTRLSVMLVAGEWDTVPALKRSVLIVMGSQCRRHVRSSGRPVSLLIPSI